MKTKTLTILSISLLTTIILGAAFIMTQAQTTLPINVAFDPKTYTWDGTPPEPWNAEIWRQKVKERYIPNTIRLEDTYQPYAATPAIHGPRLILNFHGTDVRAAIESKLPTHMGVLIPGTYRIKLKISGQLTLEGVPTPFEGYGTIRVTVPEPPPP